MLTRIDSKQYKKIKKIKKINGNTRVLARESKRKRKTEKPWPPRHVHS